MQENTTMAARKQVTWRKRNDNDRTGDIKGRDYSIRAIRRTGPAPCKDDGWRLCVLNREFPFASREALEDWCETSDFLSTLTALEAQWLGGDAPNTGIGRRVVSAPNIVQV